jgi:hypothetical protein
VARLLVQPYVDPDLWTLLRKDFLATFENADKLPSESLRGLYQLFGWIVIHHAEWLTNDESQQIVTRASHEGRQQIAWVFWSAMHAAGDRASSLWRDRIGPWFGACWQADEALKDPATSVNLIRMVLATGEAFPEAVDCVEYRLAAANRPAASIFVIKDSNMPERFPRAALKLLYLAINRTQPLDKGDLASLLKRISRSWPDAGQNRLFQELRDFAAG